MKIAKQKAKPEKEKGMEYEPHRARRTCCCRGWRTWRPRRWVTHHGTRRHVSCSTRWLVRECCLVWSAMGLQSRRRSCLLGSSCCSLFSETPWPRSLPPRTCRRLSSSALSSSSPSSQLPCLSTPLSFSKKQTQRERERERERVASWESVWLCMEVVRYL